MLALRRISSVSLAYRSLTRSFSVLPPNADVNSKLNGMSMSTTSMEPKPMDTKDPVVNTISTSDNTNTTTIIEAKSPETGKTEHFKLRNKYSLRDLSFGEVQKMGPASLRSAEEDYLLFHPVYSSKELASVKVLHKKPKDMSDKIAYNAVAFLRRLSDLPIFMSNPPTESQVLRRFIFLETVAGVPGMSAGTHSAVIYKPVYS